MGFKFAKKIKEKTKSSSASADKESFSTPHPQKTCGVRLRGVQTPLFVHFCSTAEMSTDQDWVGLDQD